MATNNSTNTPQLTLNGQLIIGSTGTIPSAATLTAGANITITNAAGSITIASSGTGTFVNQTSGSATLAAGSIYLTNNGASLVTYTLPAAPAVGDVYEVVGYSSGGWTIAQNASDLVHFGTSTTTTGVGGSLSSSNLYDKITLRNAAAHIWVAYGAQGNITVV